MLIFKYNDNYRDSRGGSDNIYNLQIILTAITSSGNFISRLANRLFFEERDAAAYMRVRVRVACKVGRGRIVLPSNCRG